MGRFENTTILESLNLITPAFVIDKKSLLRNVEQAKSTVCDKDTSLLFALKSFSITAGLEYISANIDGFAASSINEAQLARHVLSDSQQTIHVTTPGLRADEMSRLCQLADYISFNSFSQWRQFRDIAIGQVNCGLRINPQLCFVSDPRYDPCRINSKLGIPLDELSLLLENNSNELEGINGIHFHNNCDSSDWMPLYSTVEHLLDAIDPIFDRIEWINLGGGYLFDEASNIVALEMAKKKLRDRGLHRFFMEPGAAIVRSAGYLVTSVVDIFISDGKQVAILDTSINHMPEVFEYQFRPALGSDSAEGEFSYLLAGSSCLAGDLFGEYRFHQPLFLGSKVIFYNRGAYSLVKANMFNGINLPTIYIMHEQGKIEKIKHFEFVDFLSLCGEKPC